MNNSIKNLRGNKMNPTSKSSRTEVKIRKRLAEKKPRGIKKNRNLIPIPRSELE